MRRFPKWASQEPLTPSGAQTPGDAEAPVGGEVLGGGGLIASSLNHCSLELVSCPPVSCLRL